MKKRFLHIVIYLIGLMAFSAAYIVWCRISTLRIPCFFHVLTGLYCSGCGVTRMCLALVNLDFKTAFYHNRAVFICLPIGLLLGIKLLMQYVKTGSVKLSLRQTQLLWIMIVFLIAFGILRNIPQFYDLRPPI